MKILDKYIVKQFLVTFVVMSTLLLTITVVIDISNKINRLNDNGSSVKQALVEFYPYWSVWIFNTFLPIAVFITVIFFTSKIANNTEIVAITSGGISFPRFSTPYFFTALFLGLISLGVNHFLLPKASKKKNEFEYKYLLTESKKMDYTQVKSISVLLSKDEYLFVNEYRREPQSGAGFLYQKFDQKDKLKLIKNLRADQITWQPNDSTFLLSNYYIREIDKKGREKLSSGTQMSFPLKVTPDELLPEGYASEVMTSPELLRFIEREQEKGSTNLGSYKTQFHRRSSISFSVLVLTFLGLSLASEKRRGGIGLNLAIGLLIAFMYIFLGESLISFSKNEILSPVLATWMSNFLFGALALYLFIRRANQ
ncbi:MAG: YjgP/YjgQ family permease [Flavobacteriaceae bacterium]|nr:MAG: YjgP/YjgQ family permease [Flavobacteriaceae bacterium]